MVVLVLAVVVVMVVLVVVVISGGGGGVCFNIFLSTSYRLTNPVKKKFICSPRNARP